MKRGEEREEKRGVLGFWVARRAFLSASLILIWAKKQPSQKHTHTFIFITSPVTLSCSSACWGLNETQNSSQDGAKDASAHTYTLAPKPKDISITDPPTPPPSHYQWHQLTICPSECLHVIRFYLNVTQFLSSFLHTSFSTLFTSSDWHQVKLFIRLVRIHAAIESRIVKK